VHDGSPRAPESRAPYGRKRRDFLSDLPTYYGLPAVKPSHYRWLIASYVFIGGLAGAAQALACVVDLFGRQADRPVVRGGRYLALAGALASPVFLVLDLQTPGRWFNMLRIVRSTSPMSLGSWLLSAFGTTSGLLALVQALEDVRGPRPSRGLTRVLEIPALAAGLGMTCYTGTLLSATSTPLWAVAYRRLPALFATSSFSTAAAALSLLLAWGGASRGAQQRLERVSLASALAQFVATRAVEQAWTHEGVAGPVEEPRFKLMLQGGALGLGTLLPLTIHLGQTLGGRQVRALTLLAAVTTLAGGYLERAVVVLAGNRSAERPKDYFALTRPERVMEQTR
jgi:formate-dependent nitrite reductase membrane component NrfD